MNSSIGSTTGHSGTSSTAVASTIDHVNILLIGETGVGMSTFINTIANFLSYSSLEAAIQGGVKCLIPCDFHVTDTNYNVKHVKCGNQDLNEAARQPVGSSVTQNCTSYSFELPGRGKKLRFIDTPGIACTQGLAKDKENMKKIIEHIKQYESLNAICILLKPNNSRVTLQFQYCLNGLLALLSRNAVPNICFCFTNSRSALFQPEEGYLGLIETTDQIERNNSVRIAVDHENTFCFDSEPFRYLAAIEQNVEFDPMEIEDIKTSWARGYDALNGLIARAAKLSPVAVNPIYALNQARLMITDLSKPVAALSRNIETYQEIIREEEIHASTQTVEIDEAEKEQIIQASAKLTNYIKKHGIVYYNAYIGEYVNLLIQEEEQKAKAGWKNLALLDELKKSREEFHAEMTLLVNSLGTTDEMLTESDIQNLMDDIQSKNISIASYFAKMNMPPKPRVQHFVF